MNAVIVQSDGVGVSYVEFDDSDIVKRRIYCGVDSETQEHFVCELIVRRKPPFVHCDPEHTVAVGFVSVCATFTSICENANDSYSAADGLGIGSHGADVVTPGGAAG